MVTVSTPTKASPTRRSLRSSSTKSGSATPARKARASRKAQATRPSSLSRSAEASDAETKIAELVTQKPTAEPGRVEEPEKASDNRTGTLVTSVDKYNDLTGSSVAAITGGIAGLVGVDSAAGANFWSEVASTIPAVECKVRLVCVAALLAVQLTYIPFPPFLCAPACLPACSRQAKPEIKFEQLTLEQQARANANREVAEAKLRTANARAARLKKAEEAGCTPGAARSRPRARAGAGSPITDPFAQFQRFQGQMEQLFLQWQRQQHQRQ